MMVRKNSPQLMAELDAFVARYPEGSRERNVLLQKYLNKWISSAYDLFGTDNSSSAHWAYVWSIKGRYDEPKNEAPAPLAYRIFRDGRLLVVRRDGEAAADASGIAPSLQHALDHWDACEPALSALSRSLDEGKLGAPLDARALHSPLPRAYEWVDGSAFLSHVRRVRRARGAEPPPTLETDPLVYQGGSGVLLAPTEDVPLPDPAWGLDFEGEV